MPIVSSDTTVGEKRSKFGLRVQPGRLLEKYTHAHTHTYLFHYSEWHQPLAQIWCAMLGIHSSWGWALLMKYLQWVQTGLTPGQWVQPRLLLGLPINSELNTITWRYTHMHTHVHTYCQNILGVSICLTSLVLLMNYLQVWWLVARKEMGWTSIQMFSESTVQQKSLKDTNKPSKPGNRHF